MKKKSSSSKMRVIYFEIILIVLFCVFILFIATAKQVGGNHQEQANENGTTETDRVTGSATGKEEMTSEQGEVTFPYRLDSGIVIETWFQFTGINPDCKEAEGEDIISIHVSNQSGKYIKEAVIEMTLKGARRASFLIRDLPMGAELYAFDRNNTSCKEDVGATSFKEQTVYSEWNDRDGVYEVIPDGMAILVQNVSGQVTESCQVIYHDQMDGVLFGGISYQKQIGVLGDGDSQMVETPECYIGGPRIVGYAD